MIERSDVMCPGCGEGMVRHAAKTDAEASRDAGCEMIDVSFCCPQCGESVTRKEPANT